MIFQFNALIQSTVEITLRDVLRKAEESSFNLLREARLMCMDYYMNEVLRENGGKDSYLKNSFGNFNTETRKWEYREGLLLEHVPLTEQLIDLKAKNYIKQPERFVDDKPAEKYIDLLKRGNWFSFLKRAEQQMQLLNDIAIGVFLNPQTKLLFPLLVRDYYPIFDPEDPIQIDPTAILYPTAKRTAQGNVVYAYYDKDRVVEMEGAVSGGVTIGRVIKDSERENPAGVLPFFFPHRKHPIDSHFSQPREELARSNQAIDVAVSGLNGLMRANGYKAFVIVGGTKEDAKRLVMGASQAMHIDTQGIPSESLPPSASVIDMQANFESHINAINFKMERATNMLNLIVDWRIEGGQQLPGTLKLQNARDTEDREAMVENLNTFIEQPMFKIFQAVAKAHGIPIESGEDFSTNFPEPEKNLTPEQEMAWEKHNLELRKENLVDLLKSDDPDLDDEAAVEKIERNIRFSKYLEVTPAEEVESETLLSILDGIDVGIDLEGAPEPNADKAGQGEGGGRRPVQQMEPGNMGNIGG